jgi:hypothetical protein
VINFSEIEVGRSAARLASYLTEIKSPDTERAAAYYLRRRRLGLPGHRSKGR